MVNFSTLSTIFLSLFINNGELSSDVNATIAPTSVVSSKSVHAAVLIDDFADESRIFNWWDSNPENWERKWDREKEVLVIKAKNVGKDYDCFGKQFDPIDFTKTPVVRIKMKYDGETAPKIRLDIKDYDGKVANSKPIVKTLKAGDFQNYYFNLTDRFTQSWPDNSPVDPVEIVEVLLFLNPGGPDFNGTLYLDHIETIPLADMPKE